VAHRRRATHPVLLASTFPLQAVPVQVGDL
jgi:hypothetical protein